MLCLEAERIPGTAWFLMVIGGPRRFSELRADIPVVSAKVLSARLKELESIGIINRSVQPTSPPSVEYELTELGRSLEPLLLQMRDWGERFKATAQSRRPDQSGASSATPPLARHASIKQGELAT